LLLEAHSVAKVPEIPTFALFTMNSSNNSSAPRTVRVWDLPTRLFHWMLVLAVISLVITGQIGGQAMVWHFRLGYLAGSLLIFRLVWGLIGGYYSRFLSFIYSPASVFNYLKGRASPAHLVGHNPLGAFSVFAMLGLLLLQVCTGLVSDDEIAFAGPLSRFVSGQWVSLATTYHKAFGKVFIIVLVLVHVAAIVFYYVKKKENLVAPMVCGDKEVTADVPHSSDGLSSRVLAFVVFVAAAGLFAWIASLMP
jgi:cytochrome b